MKTKIKEQIKIFETRITYLNQLMSNTNQPAIIGRHKQSILETQKELLELEAQTLSQ